MGAVMVAFKQNKKHQQWVAHCFIGLGKCQICQSKTRPNILIVKSIVSMTDGN